MRCPICGTEMRVAERIEQAASPIPVGTNGQDGASGQTEAAGQAARYTLLRFACRSPQCSACGRIMAEKRVEADNPEKTVVSANP